jgi:hypothetical protein
MKLIKAMLPAILTLGCVSAPKLEDCKVVVEKALTGCQVVDAQEMTHKEKTGKVLVFVTSICPEANKVKIVVIAPSDEQRIAEALKSDGAAATGKCTMQNINYTIHEINQPMI